MVHLRGYGEHAFGFKANIQINGSSPWVRRTLVGIATHARFSRFISVGTENTNLSN